MKPITHQYGTHSFYNGPDYRYRENFGEEVSSIRNKNIIRREVEWKETQLRIPHFDIERVMLREMKGNI